MLTRYLTRALLASAALLWTWLWLLPIGGFHHMFRCGVLGWAVLDWDSEEFAVRWSLLALVLSLAAWLGGGVAVLVVRRRARAR